MKNSMKFFILTAFFLTTLFINTEKASAQNRKWTYAMVMNGITYKIHFQEERGSQTVQLYTSSSNKWSFATILDQRGAGGATSYYKIKDGAGNVYEMWPKTDGTLTVRGSTTTWTYYLER